MRLGRWLILGAILSIVAFVADTYWKHRSMFNDPLAAPRALDPGTESNAQKWCSSDADGAKPTFKICATNAREIKDPPHWELDNLTLQLYHKNGTEYDLIESPKGEFDKATNTLYSDSPADITMGVTADGPQHGRLLKIHTSGVHFDKESGHASTDRAARFEFDQGTGSAVGAEYDPNTRQLHLRSQAVLDWTGKTEDAKPMHIEAAEAYYFERESKVVLLQWSKLRREGLNMDAGEAEVLMDHNTIKRVDAKSGRGVEEKDDRTETFSADHLGLDFGDHMLIRHIEGSPHASLVEVSASGQTTATGDRMDMDFDISSGDSVLLDTVTAGNSVAESVPVSEPGSSAETRVLRSETIRMKMQPGGKDIASAETDGAATLDFLPLRPDQPKRDLQGDRVWIVYRPGNHVESFRSINATTRTEKPPTPKQPTPPPALTSSKEIFATFDPKTSELATVEQKGDFHYEEGDRQARADIATLDQQKDVMTLDGKARLADPSGSTNADRIVIDQKSGDFRAEGNVASTRQPDSNGKSSAMLDTDKVMEARAQSMVSTGRGIQQKIHYEGKAGAPARMWQGSNRVTADRLDIDRNRHVLEAHGHTVSQFVDKDKDKDDNAKDGQAKGAPAKEVKTVAVSGSKPATNSKAAASVYTVVTAPDLVYSDETRLAVYQGGVELQRPGMRVVSQILHAFLKDADSSSSLDKAIADGKVQVFSSQAGAAGKPQRKRTSSSEHAEYYADEGKVIIEGGKPELIDSGKSEKATGQQLTWWANDDTFIVKGDESDPAKNTIRKKN
jgi:lipopolysaccharide export system protein LptA